VSTEKGEKGTEHINICDLTEYSPGTACICHSMETEEILERIGGVPNKSQPVALHEFLHISCCKRRRERARGSKRSFYLPGSYVIPDFFAPPLLALGRRERGAFHVTPCGVGPRTSCPRKRTEHPPRLSFEDPGLE